MTLNDIVVRLINNAKSDLSRLAEEVNQELDAHEKNYEEMDSIKSYTFKKIRKCLGSRDLAKQMNELLRKVRIPEIDLSIDEVSYKAEMLETENLRLANHLLNVLIKYGHTVNALYPDLIGQYISTVAESKMKRITLDMLSGTNVELEDALMAIKGIEQYITQLSHKDKTRIRQALRTAPIETHACSGSGISSFERESNRSMYNLCMEVYKKKVEEIDAELGIDVDTSEPPAKDYGLNIESQLKIRNIVDHNEDEIILRIKTANTICPIRGYNTKKGEKVDGCSALRDPICYLVRQSRIHPKVEKKEQCEIYRIVLDELSIPM